MEFTPWPKIARANREWIITEKVDGTNACIVIEEHPFGSHDGDGIDDPNLIGVTFSPITEETGESEFEYHVYAQSRNRFITKHADNNGFANWVIANIQSLVDVLGPGKHFGEWAGLGVNKNRHRLDRKRFYLFNTHRWAGMQQVGPSDLDMSSVPILATAKDIYELSSVVDAAMEHLLKNGSIVGGDNPEGIIVHHPASQASFKITYDYDGTGKWDTSQDNQS